MGLYNSFKSFQQLLLENRELEKRLADHEKYHAHTHQHKPPELLVDHVNLVISYALRLIETHQLEPVIERLITPLRQQSYVVEVEATGNFVKRLFLNTIVFHDYGKINENFQRERMGNNRFQPNPANGIGSQHSILSAFLFIIEHLREINDSAAFNAEIQAVLYALTFWFSNSIIKHHASYLENEIKLDDEKISALSPYLEGIGLPCEETFLRAAFSNFEAKIKECSDACFSDACRFSVYSLLKLNFSLLTAADYYATSAFAMDLAPEDFGVLAPAEKTAFFKKFRSTQKHNQTFFKRKSFFTKYPEKKLQRCNPQNLNILRQKLLGEVIDAVKKNKERNIFYLEAPTGSGKTNLSMAAALQLLKNHPELNKVFYVFPFTTLITQTAQAIRQTLHLNSAQMVQLHSRSGFHSKREEQEDGQYGAQHLNHLDNLFVNYPVTLLTHIKFFDILKGNGKESTYLFHRLANAVIIIDELQSYPPGEWDKIAYFITQCAHYFNIKFILMSATLPKLDELEIANLPQEFCALVESKERYFLNPNFKNRVEFDFSLLQQSLDLNGLAEIFLQKCEDYANKNQGKVKAIIEFIYKQTATDFYKKICARAQEAGFEIYVLSGTILEPRRREIINLLKTAGKNPKAQNKILLISTQVVEAGVDIDMDIGFKHRSLIDSDEQLAGRVNRNARPQPAKVYIFNVDSSFRIYGQDLRYRITRDHISQEEYERILRDKGFDNLYGKVCERINQDNANEFLRNFNEYKDKIKRLEFRKISSDFKLIDQQTVTIFVPLKIPVEYFSDNDLAFLSRLQWNFSDGAVDGKKVWDCYLSIIHSGREDFVKKKTDLKKIYGIMSQFMFSIFAYSNQVKELLRFCDGESHEKYNVLYLKDWQEVYNYKSGIQDEKFKEVAFL